MALNSAVVVAGDDATAAQYNNLRKDTLLHAGDTLVDSSVSANTVTVAIPAQVAALENGMILKIEVKTTNTGATNLSLTGGITDTVDLMHQNGAELSKGDIQAGQYIYCIYDNTNDRFEIISKTYLEKTLYKGTAGETVTAGQPLYFKASDSKLWKLDTTANGEAAQAFVGWVVVGGNADATIVVCYEYTNAQSGLTAGSPVFGTNTAGAVSHTAGTVTKQLGVALSATEVLTKEAFVATGTLSTLDDDATGSDTLNVGFRPKLVMLQFDIRAWVCDDAGTSCNGKRVRGDIKLANSVALGFNGVATVSAASYPSAPTCTDFNTGVSYDASVTNGGNTQNATLVFSIANTGLTRTYDLTTTDPAHDHDATADGMNYIILG